MLLEGIRVIDWTQYVAGPAAACRLGALGAEVIHVEQPGKGDAARGVKSFMGIDQVLSTGGSAEFEYWNYNKKSITVDLRKEKGREIIYRLVQKSDVFITNQVMDTIEKLKMDFGTLSKHNGRLIYAWASMLGARGPYRLTPGWDMIGQAASGIMMTSGSYGDPPTLATFGVADHCSDLALVAGILGALYWRERTGRGQKVETSQIQAGINGVVASLLGLYLLKGGEVRGITRENANNPIFNWYKCKDDRWVVIGSATEKYWPTLIKVINRPDLMDDPRFENREKREKNNKELIRILDEIFASKTLDAWIEKFKGIDFPFYPINRLRDIPTDPQVIANDYLFTFEHPVLGRVQYPGMPFTYSETPSTVRSGAPELGQHTEEVLLEIGYSWKEIEELHKEEAL